jgi:glutamyl-tRNA synthetase|tara:strand:+ start:4064 stop:5464 length:1401 start_codon:yes stop_codon:yes gene_type:complete
VEDKKQVVTRFAPSPTGYLHIGGVRTALFNWLYAKNNNGKFLLRIEDTDRERSTKSSIQIILNGLRWLDLNYDEEVIYQHKNIERHIEIANLLLKEGKAYKCWATENELNAMREEAKKRNLPIKYNGMWRNKKEGKEEEGKPFVIRFRSPEEGETIIYDKVQGKVSFKNEIFDDFILLRSDGTPTYMLSVVVDDHDMGITHIIRGDDHLTNAAKQKNIYESLDWKEPVFSHIPLIHGSDGSKLSKRHGALGIDEYEKDGFLPDAMKNYLLRLGWSHGDKEIFSQKDMIKLFSIKNIGKSSSKLDLEKLKNINNYYIKNSSEKDLLKIIKKSQENLHKDQEKSIIKILPEIKKSAKTSLDIINSINFITAEKPIKLDKDSKEILTNQTKIYIEKIKKNFQTLDSWDSSNIEQLLKDFAISEELKFKDIALPLRAILTGTLSSPSIYIILDCLGKDEVISRINDILKN